MLMEENKTRPLPELASVTLREGGKVSFVLIMLLMVIGSTCMVLLEMLGNLTGAAYSNVTRSVLNALANSTLRNSTNVNSDHE